MIRKIHGECPRYWAAERGLVDIESHWHEFYEAEFVLEGDAVEYINGREVLVPAGSFVLLSPKDFHSIVSRDRREMRFLTFCFRESEINGAISDLFAKYPVPYVVRFDREDAGRYVSLFRELCGVIDDESTAQDMDISRMLVMSVIEHMILFAAAGGITSGDISRENPTASSDDERLRSLHMLLSYIEENLSREIRRDELAEYMHFSPNYLSSFFRKALGMPMSRYISDLRLDRAAKLLGGTEEPVNFIMDSVGYRSRSLFYRDFTEKFGMAPGEYRKAAVAPRE